MVQMLGRVIFNLQFGGSIAANQTLNKFHLLLFDFFSLVCKVQLCF